MGKRGLISPHNTLDVLVAAQLVQLSGLSSGPWNQMNKLWQIDKNYWVGADNRGNPEMREIVHFSWYAYCAPSFIILVAFLKINQLIMHGFLELHI